MSLEYYKCKKCGERRVKLYASIPDLCPDCQRKEDYQNAEDKKNKVSKVRVWWIPQLPSKNPFYVDVPDIKTGKMVCDILANYDTYQYENRIKPDYCNTGGVQTFEDGEWVDIDEED
jgi:hypothetical protein